MSKLVACTYKAFALFIAVFLFVFGAGTSELFQELRGFWWLLNWLVGLVFIGLLLIALFKDKQKTHAILAMFLMIVFLTFSTKIWRLGGVMSFYLHKARYESKVQQIIAATTEEERKRICSEDCWIYASSGDQSSIAFHFAHGFLNWHDFVYDPSGSMARPNPPYTGYFVASEHLTGNWYFCHFAD